MYIIIYWYKGSYKRFALTHENFSIVEGSKEEMEELGKKIVAGGHEEHGDMLKGVNYKIVKI